ncbi:MAG: glycosyltransferase family 1 protein [Dehalococcoidia bacterium]|nr:glycosyltransferase family 1 protein [Dehalococcoidia bacterium]
MRIALVSPYDYSYPGGVTVHIQHLRDNFLQAGHEVKIIAPSSKPIDDCEGVIPCGRPYSVPASGSIARIALSLRLSTKVKTILAEDFDIVHLHEPLMPTLPITTLRFSETVNVGTFHAHNDRSLAYFYGRRILKRWFRKLDGKIAVSKPAMDFAGKYFPGYYNIIPNGIDVERFSNALPFENLMDGKLTILFVGRLEKRKGLKYLIRAFAKVKKEMPNTRLIIVGPDGGLRRGYENTIEKNDIPDVHFLDYVSSEDLPRYYKSADVFCAPATGQESFGIVLLEAMAAGTPVIASDIEGYSQVVSHGKEGLLVPPKDENALAMTIVHLLADRDMRSEMGRRGVESAKGYSWTMVAKMVSSYYERLLSEGTTISGDTTEVSPADVQAPEKAQFKIGRWRL